MQGAWHTVGTCLHLYAWLAVLTAHPDFYLRPAIVLLKRRAFWQSEQRVKVEAQPCRVGRYQVRPRQRCLCPFHGAVGSCLFPALAAFRLRQGLR